MVLFLSQKRHVIRNPALALVIGKETKDFKTCFQWLQESLRVGNVSWGGEGPGALLLVWRAKVQQTFLWLMGLSWSWAGERRRLLCYGNSASRTRWLGDLGGLSSLWKLQGQKSELGQRTNIQHTFSIAGEVTDRLTRGLWPTEPPLLAQSTVQLEKQMKTWAEIVPFCAPFSDGSPNQLRERRNFT